MFSAEAVCPPLPLFFFGGKKKLLDTCNVESVTAAYLAGKRGGDSTGHRGEPGAFRLLQMDGKRPPAKSKTICRGGVSELATEAITVE